MIDQYQNARVHGLALGLVAGLEIGLGSRPMVGAEVALIRATIANLTAASVDFERMVGDWVRVLETDAAHPDTRAALAWLDRERMPPGPADQGDSASVLIRFLPVVVLAAGSPVNLVSGSFHLTALWTGDPASQWSAVAAQIAAAQFLRGRKDFIPDAIEALQANDAPALVIEAIRAVPFSPLGQVAGSDQGSTLGTMRLALWFAQREPRLEVAWQEIRERRDRSPWLAPVVGAVLGARDGVSAVRRGFEPSADAEADAAGLVQLLAKARQES